MTDEYQHWKDERAIEEAERNPEAWEPEVLAKAWRDRLASFPPPTKPPSRFRRLIRWYPWRYCLRAKGGIGKG